MSRRSPYWTEPLPPFVGAVTRWATFRLSVVERIEAIRSEEGHTGGPWCAFGRPLPERIGRLDLPIGKVAPGPPPPPRGPRPRTRTIQAS